MKNKLFSLLLLITIFIISISAAYAEETSQAEELTLSETFPSLKYRDQYVQISPAKYYRFPIDNWFFDPLGLSYFPFESIETDKWALLGRWKDGYTGNQMIYIDHPAQNKVIHGADLGQGPGYLRDFYLYADLYVSDSFPEGTGSCFLYYSNSMVIGYDNSYGVLIDPQEGIFKANNDYKLSSDGYFSGYYRQGDSKHSLRLMNKLSPESYSVTFSDRDFETLLSDSESPADGQATNTLMQPKVNSHGASSFPAMDLDKQFNSDFEFVTARAGITQDSPVKIYRLEIIRINGYVDLYINGIQAASFKDTILTTKEIQKKPDKVSWSYGPILYKGGQTVTCSIGNLVIYGTGLRED